MPIEALSQDTIRLLGSPLVVTSPVSLVKELIENSIDAGATSIEVLISPNSVDRIEVRDNGQGIYPDDFDSLGRRGHTSKLRSFADLQTVGGRFLGFRGEALAGANALGTVTITTKTSTDNAAATLHLIPGDGGVAKQQYASAPAGTTVSVTGLFARLPVREQLAIKESQKTMTKIKELLLSYAFARYHLRLSFKVLRNAKLGWSYSPRPQAGLKEAVLQAFGAGLASECLLENYTASIEDSSGDGGESNGELILEAVLPKPNADPSKVCKGAYLSVDSRPVSHTRGTMRKLMSAFKAHLTNGEKISYKATPPRDAFIRLDIMCPTGWYDPNVEPSKDDLIFCDESRVLDAFEDLCCKVYGIVGASSAGEEHNSLVNAKGQIEITINDDEGETAHDIPSPAPGRQLGSGSASEDIVPRQVKQEESTTRQGISRNSRGYFWERQSHNQNVGSFDTDQKSHLGQVSSASSQSSNSPDANHRAESPRQPSHGKEGQGLHRGWKVDMSANPDVSSDEDDEVVDARSRMSNMTHGDDAAAEEPAGSKEALNPWTIAKMTASNKSQQERWGHQALDVPRKGTDLDTLPSMAEEQLLDEGLPILQHPIGPPGDLEVPRNQQRRHLIQTKVPGGPYRSPLPSSPCQSSTSQARALTGSNVLPTPPSSLDDRNYRSGGMKGNAAPEYSALPKDGYIQTALSLNRERISQDVSARSLPDLRSTTNDIKSPPLSNRGKLKRFASYRGGHQHRATGVQGARIEELRGDTGAHGRTLGDFDVRQHLRPETPYNTTSLEPGNERSLAASPTPVEDPGTFRLPIGDPRNYITRRQGPLRSNESRPRWLERVEIDLLPLERTPQDDEMCKFVLAVRINKQQLAGNCDHKNTVDNYYDPNSARSVFEMAVEMGDVSRLEMRIRGLWTRWTRKSLGKGMELGLDLSKLEGSTGEE